MVNSFSLSRRSEELVRCDSPTLTFLRVPIASANSIAPSLHSNHHVQSLELDFSATSSIELMIRNTIKANGSNAKLQESMRSLLSLLTSTSTLQHIQLFGARSEIAVRYLLPPLLRAIQRNPSRPNLDLVCCRILPTDFGLLPAHSALRGVRLWEPAQEEAADDTATMGAIAVAAHAVASHTSLQRLRLTAYLGLPLLQQLLLHVPSTVEQVTVYHHGCSRAIVEALSQLPATVSYLQVEYLQCGGLGQPTTTASSFVIPQLRGQQTNGQRRPPSERSLTFISCTFGDDPWPYLDGASVCWEGICPTIQAPLTVRHLDVSKLVIERKQRLNEIIYMAGSCGSTIAFLVLGDVTTVHCSLLVDYLLPHTRTLRRLHCKLVSPSSVLWSTHFTKSSSIVGLSTALRQAVRMNTSLIEFQLDEDDRNSSPLLSAEDAAAIQWYTEGRNRRLPALDPPLDDLWMLPRSIRWSWDAPKTGPSRVCRQLMESLPY